MDRGFGIVLVIVAVALLGATAAAFRHRIAGVLPTALLAAEGMLLAAGALLLVDGAGPADWVVGLAIAAVALPAHLRFLLATPEPPSGSG